MIDLRRLQVLRAVHQHGTVTAAAEALHLTPSAVSHSLRELARELKVPLIEPQGRRIKLTSAALLVVKHSDELMARWEETRAALESFRAGESGALRMCGFPTSVSGLLAPAAARLAREQPALQVTVTECESKAGFDLLLSDDADLLLLTPTDSGPSPGDARFDLATVMSEPLDLLLPAGHRLARRKRIGLTDAADEAWVLPVPGTCDHHHRAMVACATAGFTPRVGHFVTEWGSVAALVAYGLGVSLIPRIADLPSGHDVVRVPLTVDPVPTRQIVSCVRRGSREHPVIQRGLTAIQDVIADRVPSAA